MACGINFAFDWSCCFVTETPVRLDFNLPILQNEGMRGWKLLYPSIDRSRRWNVIEGQVQTQRLQVELGVDRRMRQQNFRLRREQKGVFEHAPVERFFTKTVTRDKQSTAICIP